MTTIPTRSAALAATALTTLGAVGALAAVVPVHAASPSFPVVCSSVQVEAPRNVATSFTLDCADEEGNPVDEYVVLTQPTKAQSFTVNAATGQVSYRPAAGADGTDSFTFKGVTTGLGESTPTTATITLGNERPVCEPVGDVTVVHDRSATIAITCSDADGDALTVTTGTVGASHGSVATAEGVVYTPAAGYTGTDAFTLRAGDGDLFSEEVTVEVTVTNARPVCTGGTLSVVHDRSRTATLVCTDADDDALTHAVVAAPQHGTVTVEDDRIVYRPAARYVGKDTFTIGATDGLQASVPVRYDVVVKNALPTCDGGGAITAKDRTPARVRFSCKDRDGDKVTPTVVAKPRHGRLVEKKDGTWWYVADRGYRGRDTFTMAGTDKAGRSRVETYTVRVTGRR